jgi:hypothetical protein
MTDVFNIPDCIEEKSGAKIDVEASAHPPHTMA